MHRLTKQGSLKDTTDCSPSNGYYFLPVYDKGDYILKISPPPGWSFEPEQINIAFDGQTDACSLGKDVNFVFKVISLMKYVVPRRIHKCIGLCRVLESPVALKCWAKAMEPKVLRSS